jgi:hypothetical protein
VAAAGEDVLIRLGVALCLLLAPAGCGSGPTVSSDGETANSARFELVMTRTDKQGQMVMSGSYDYGRKQGSMSARLVGAEEANDDVGGEVRFFGDRFYSEEEAEGKTYWVVETEEPVAYPNEAIVPFPGAGIDPQQALELIRVSGGELENLGAAEVRGAATTHYRIEVDPKQLAEHLSPGRRLAHGDPSQDKPFAVEVWADEAGRLRRIRIRDEMVDEDSVTETYEFFDFGAPVDVERPPADQVVSYDEFDKLTTPTDDEMMELCAEELPKEECERMHEERR